jgi:hypothetical protein
MTTRLWEVDHPYYCEEMNYFATPAGSVQPTKHYESWAEFYEEEGECAFDMNLLFRWDWREADPPNEELWGIKVETLFLFWMGQRNGIYRWTTVHVSKSDEPAIREWLLKRLNYLVELWEPLFPAKPG